MPVPDLHPPHLNPFSQQYTAPFSPESATQQPPPQPHPGFIDDLQAGIEHLNFRAHRRPAQPQERSSTFQGFPSGRDYPTPPNQSYDSYYAPPGRSQTSGPIVLEPSSYQSEEPSRQHLLPAPHLPKLLRRHGEKSSGVTTDTKRSKRRSSVIDSRPEVESFSKSTVHPGSAISRDGRGPPPNYSSRVNIGSSSDPYETGYLPRGQSLSKPPQHVEAVCRALPGIANRLRESTGYNTEDFEPSEYTSVKEVKAAAGDLEEAFHREHGGEPFKMRYFKNVCHHLGIDWANDTENALRCVRIRLRERRHLEVIEYGD
ncbi:MAG: hypothetical protein Q9162_002666 [Coniocarpon cinnabarinum]